MPTKRVIIQDADGNQVAPVSTADNIYYDANTTVKDALDAKGVSLPCDTLPCDTLPLMDGNAHAGVADQYARGDHRHPTDTSRANAYNFFVEHIPDTTDHDYSGEVQSFTTTIADSDVAQEKTDVYFENGACEVNITLEDRVLQLVENPSADYEEGDLYYVVNRSSVYITLKYRAEQRALLGLSQEQELEWQHVVMPQNKWICFEYISGMWRKKGGFHVVLCDRHNERVSDIHKIVFPELQTNKTIGSAAFANTTAFASANHTHTVTKADVGLGNVNNTSDSDKPISTAMSTALSGKADKVVPSEAGNVAALDANGNLTDSGKTVNNAALTIQRNGVTLDSFGANAKTAKTINIEVPELAWTLLVDKSSAAAEGSEENVSLPTGQSFSGFSELLFVYAFASIQIMDTNVVPTSLFYDANGFVLLKDVGNNQQAKVKYVNDSELKFSNTDAGWNIKVYGR